MRGKSTKPTKGELEAALLVAATRIGCTTQDLIDAVRGKLEAFAVLPREDRNITLSHARVCYAEQIIALTGTFRQVGPKIMEDMISGVSGARSRDSRTYARLQQQLGKAVEGYTWTLGLMGDSTAQDLLKSFNAEILVFLAQTQEDTIRNVTPHQTIDVPVLPTHLLAETIPLESSDLPPPMIEQSAPAPVQPVEPWDWDTDVP